MPNADINTINAWTLANYRSMGVSRVVDYQQAGSPYRLADYSQASFSGLNAIGNEADNFIHPNDAGYAILTGYYAAQLRGMPVR